MCSVKNNPMPPMQKWPGKWPGKKVQETAPPVQNLWEESQKELATNFARRLFAIYDETTSSLGNPNMTLLLEACQPRVGTWTLLKTGPVYELLAKYKHSALFNFFVSGAVTRLSVLCQYFKHCQDTEALVDVHNVQTLCTAATNTEKYSKACTTLSDHLPSNALDELNALDDVDELYGPGPDESGILAYSAPPISPRGSPTPPCPSKQVDALIQEFAGIDLTKEVKEKVGQVGKLVNAINNSLTQLESEGFAPLDCVNALAETNGDEGRARALLVKLRTVNNNLATLTGMGFEKKAAKAALKKENGALEKAINLLLACPPCLAI